MNTNHSRRKVFRFNSILLLASSAGFFLTSCVPRPQPLSALGPMKIGPVSCRLDPTGPTKPGYASTATDMLKSNGNNGGGIGGAIAGLILSGAEAAAKIPGQRKLDNITAAVDSMERETILENFRKQLVAAGFTVKEGAPSTAVVNVIFYGVHKNMGGQTQILINSRLIVKDSAGKPIWTSTAVPVSNLPKQQFDDFVKAPSLYRREFGAAANEHANGVVNGVGLFSQEYDPTKQKPKS